MTKKIKIIECPRDAMQGIIPFISTKKKVAYLNKLLGVGFDTLDFGSFVSPKAVPQMNDTAEVALPPIATGADDHQPAAPRAVEHAVALLDGRVAGLLPPRTGRKGRRPRYSA